MRSPRDPDVLRLRSWRAACRPAQCKGLPPCWVDDPYAAISAARNCFTCRSSIPQFDAVKFREFCLLFSLKGFLVRSDGKADLN